MESETSHSNNALQPSSLFFIHSRAASRVFLARAATLAPNQAETVEFAPPTPAGIKDFTLLGNCLVAGRRPGRVIPREGERADKTTPTQHVPLEGKENNINHISRSVFFWRLRQLPL